MVLWRIEEVPILHKPSSLRQEMPDRAESFSSNQGRVSDTDWMKRLPFSENSVDSSAAEQAGVRQEIRIPHEPFVHRM